MIRYILEPKSNTLWNKELDTSIIDLPLTYQKRFVNILEHNEEEHVMLIKVYYPDGQIYEGWVSTFDFPIGLSNQKELFDGRFNQ